MTDIPGCETCARLAEVEAERDRLRALVDQARDIIADVSPGHTVWLDAADAALDADHDR